MCCAIAADSDTGSAEIALPGAFNILNKHNKARNYVSHNYAHISLLKQLSSDNFLLHYFSVKAIFSQSVRIKLDLPQAALLSFIIFVES